MPSTYVTSPYRYVLISAGLVLINGMVLHIKDDFQIPESELTSGDGDYYVYIRPNRRIMAQYYNQDWEYILRYVTAAGQQPPDLPDEMCIGRIEKRATSPVLSAVELNRDLSVITLKDLSVAPGNDGQVLALDSGSDTGMIWTTEAGDKYYLFTKTVAGATWNINHGLNKMPVVKTVNGSGQEVIGDITWVDINNITIVFSEAITGQAFLS